MVGRTNQEMRKAKIVGRIKGGALEEKEQQQWINIDRKGDKGVKISFGSDQNPTTSSKQSYELDECYEQDVDTEEIFSRELKPLVPGLFGGQNCTVFAYGPRSSGKSFTIQGHEEQLGLAALMVDALLPLAVEEGKIITISVFEVYQERVIDLLDSKRPEVSVFEVGQGKIRLKGLSKVEVDSTAEFQKLYIPVATAHKPSQKPMAEPPHRSHIGCIVHVVTPQTETSKAQLVGKINFIDLASYEDSRRKSGDSTNLSETTKINKSLFAVTNVLYALNASEPRPPYRDSKLTHMLQDSLGGMHRVLMISCMNPFSCQETVQTISVASKSCQAGFLASLDPGKGSRSANKAFPKSSPHIPRSASKSSVGGRIFSPKVMKPMSASAASVKKQVGSQLRASTLKPRAEAPEVKGRKLFEEANQSRKSEQEKKGCESASIVESTGLTEVTFSQEEAISESFTQKEVDCNDVSSTTSAYQTPPTEILPLDDKENKLAETSPPLSMSLRELSNNLRSLCLSADASLKLAQERTIPRNQVTKETSEPETPILQLVGADDKNENTSPKESFSKSSFEPKTPNTQLIGTNDRYDFSNIASPWENFHMRGSGMKNNLVQEYLKLLNTANKEELKALKGIGEKRATYILEMRAESPEPFKKLDDLKDIGLSEKQINVMLKKVAADLFI